MKRESQVYLAGQIDGPGPAPGVLSPVPLAPDRSSPQTDGTVPSVAVAATPRPRRHLQPLHQAAQGRHRPRVTRRARPAATARHTGRSGTLGPVNCSARGTIWLGASLRRHSPGSGVGGDTSAPAEVWWSDSSPSGGQGVSEGARSTGHRTRGSRRSSGHPDILQLFWEEKGEKANGSQVTSSWWHCPGPAPRPPHSYRPRHGGAVS